MCICVSYVYVLEKAMATQSSTLAWKIPWTEEPGRLQSTGSRRVGHDWATSLSLFTFMQWRRKWQPTPGFLPGESQGQQSLVGCHLWGRTASDTTEAMQQQQHVYVFIDIRHLINKVEIYFLFVYFCSHASLKQKPLPFPLLLTSPPLSFHSGFSPFYSPFTPYHPPLLTHPLNLVLFGSS